MDLDLLLGAEPRRIRPTVAAAFGLALGFYPGPRFSPCALLLSIGLFSLGTVVAREGETVLPRRAARLRARQAYAMAAGLALGCAVAWAEAGRSAPPWDPAGVSKELRLSWAEGRLSTDSSPARNGFRSYALAVDRIGLAGPGVSAELSFVDARHHCQLRVLSNAGPEIDSGSRIRARGEIPSSGSGPSGGAALFAQAEDVLVIDRGSAIDRARSAVRDACRRALARIGKASAGLLQALILGVRDSLAPDEAEAFRAAGCAHILALSGEHLSVLALLAIAGLRPLVGPVRARLGGAILATGFMWIAGAGPSLLRSVLMVWIGAIALALDRPQDWLSVLALSFLATLPLDPEAARGLSFTLSYLAVWGLAVFGPRFAFALGKLLPPFILEPASASLAAQVAVSPLLALTFGCIQLAGIPASMAAAPLVTATMWWGMGAGLLCSIFPPAIPAAVHVSDFLYVLLMGIMKTAAAVPALPLPGLAARFSACAAIVGFASFVYARPHAEFARLRFAQGPAGPPRGRGLGHVQAIRPELPGQ